MLNFPQTIPRAAKAADDVPIVAAPFPLADSLCRQLTGEGIIRGYIADRRCDFAQSDLVIRGWWVDHNEGVWFLRNTDATTLILLGGDREHGISGPMLLEARLKGIRRILLVAEDGSIARDIDVATELVNQLKSVQLAKPIHRQSYDALIEEIFSLVGDRLRLPYEAFAPDRIMLLIGNLQGGGAERQAAYTAIGLAQHYPGHVYLGRQYVGGDHDFYQPMLESAGVQLCAVPDPSLEFDAPDIMNIRKQLSERYSGLSACGIFNVIFHHALLIRRLRPGLVHTWLDYSNVLAGIAADWVGVPRLVLGGRSMAPDNFTIFQPYMAPGYRALFKRREPLFLNNSKAGSLDYSRWLGLPQQRFHVLHNGFEFPDVSPRTRSIIRRTFDIPDGAIVVGSILRFSEEKRPDFWLEMAKNIHATHPRTRFIVFGNGPMLEPCRAYVKANQLERIIQLPGVTRDAWAGLSAMDIFVLTSRAEGLSNVMIEAQAMGLPVISTDAGGMTETFLPGETGLIVETDTPEGFAATVRKLIDDVNLNKNMGHKATAYARKSFGLERMIEGTVEAYRHTPEHKSRLSAPTEQDGELPTRFNLQGITHVRGHCFRAEVSHDIDLSKTGVCEDYKALGPRVANDDEIRRSGGGRFVDAEHAIYFSSSDNSDPRFNGRMYRLRWQDDSEISTRTILSPDRVNQESGNCFIVQVGDQLGVGHPELWEDDRMLGPGDSIHDSIREEGGGRYSIWGTNIYFSSSDNSDPRANNRCYALIRGKVCELPPTETSRPKALPIEKAFQHLVCDAVPGNDFVRRRAVHVCGTLGPGGAERQLLYTLQGLNQKGFESVQLLCFRLAPTAREPLDFYLPAFKAAGIPVRTIRSQVGRGELASLPKSLREMAESLPPTLTRDTANLYWEFVSLKPAVVHAWLDGCNIPAGLAAALAGVPRIILSGRNLNPKYFPFYEPYMDWAYRALLDLPQVTMINNSRTGRDDYADWLDVERTRIDVIYNGVDFSSMPQISNNEVRRLRERYSLEPDTFVVGGIFRFAAEKRPLLWIDAVAELAQRHSNVRFILFGHGPLQVEMERVARERGLEKILVFAGVTSEIFYAISIMNVLLLTSAVEGTPNVILEAQWLGKPVVATAAGGTGEAMEQGKTGWIIDPVPSAIADRLLWLHENPGVRSAVQELGPALIKRRFGVERMIDQTLALYHRPAALFGAAH